MQIQRIRPKSRERVSFSKVKEPFSMPDLIEVQKNSYAWLFNHGLRELFDEISPVKDFIGRDLELYFLDYYLDEPKFDEKMSKDKNLTYEASLRVKTRLINKRTNETREQEIF